MKIRFLGHSGFEIKMKNHTLVFDPYISPNELASHINLSEVQPDFVLLTHGHGDHIADAEQLSKDNDALCISNYEVINWLGAKGVKGHPLNHGGKKEFAFGTAKYVNAIHTSSFPDGTYAGNPGGFVIWDDEICFYHAGDTALTLDMKLIPLTCPKLDFAILPIGDNFTMGYEDAAIAADYIDCPKIIGCHFNTFAPITIDLEKAKEAFKNRGKELILLEIGDSIEM